MIGGSREERQKEKDNDRGWNERKDWRGVEREGMEEERTKRKEREKR